MNTRNARIFVNQLFLGLGDIYPGVELVGPRHQVPSGVAGTWASQVALAVQSLPASAGGIRDPSLISGSGRSLEEGMATHSSAFAWRTPRLRSLAGSGPESQRY